MLQCLAAGSGKCCNRISLIAIFMFVERPQKSASHQKLVMGERWNRERDSLVFSVNESFCRNPNGLR
jgi:hypothetical protein